ncbi:MAG: GNAT family N-acetyltransferase [Desulfarculales bacterium]|jgi:hypothetical protein|nr:GNAT family N-acetyltransferase [Desulfarculales bacterium]
MKLHEFTSAADIPPSWDEGLGNNIYLKRNFLRFMEGRSDAEDSRYYMFSDDKGIPDSRFMLFTRKKYVITQFTRFSLTAFTRFVYVPLSVARPGVHLGEGSKKNFFDLVRALRGMRLVFNLPQAIRHPAFVQIKTCPRCVLDLRWSSFEEYLADLRSHYRYRAQKALKKSSALKIGKLADNNSFNEELYALYLQVMERADYKIETLSLDFFRGGFFDIFVMQDDAGKYVAFYQLLENGDELIFEFTGLDARQSVKYDAYNRMLLEIVRYGIERGFRRIDFGQTAEEAKLRLGCRYEHIYVLASHSNRFLNFLFRACASLLNYKPFPENRFRVFKSVASEEGDNP